MNASISIPEFKFAIWKRKTVYDRIFEVYKSTVKFMEPV
jgi:hypothetical protein